MKPTQAINAVTSPMLKSNLPEFGVGDTVRVSVRVVEGNRERIQVFEGVVMRKRRGGINANFTVRRIASHGIGVERTFLLHSPRVDKIEIVRRGVVRRAQLYYLRGRTGKAARIKERRYRPGERLAATPAAPSTNGATAPAPTPEPTLAVDELEPTPAAVEEPETTPAETTEVPGPEMSTAEAHAEAEAAVETPAEETEEPTRA